MTNYTRNMPFAAVEGPFIHSNVSRGFDELLCALIDAVATEQALEATAPHQHFAASHFTPFIRSAEASWQAVDTVLFKLMNVAPQRPEDTAFLRVADLINMLRSFEDEEEAAQIYASNICTRGWLQLHAAQSTMSSVVNFECAKGLDLFKTMASLRLYGGDGMQPYDDPNGVGLAVAA